MTSKQYKATRERMGMTQAALAAALNVSRKAINEREKAGTIKRETAIALQFLELQSRSISAANPVLDALESLARMCSHTRKAEKDYRGQIAGTLVTDSQALGDVADALEVLADNKRFRVAASMGRMVVGYWPENDPLLDPQNVTAPSPVPAPAA